MSALNWSSKFSATMFQSKAPETKVHTLADETYQGPMRPIIFHIFS